MALFPQSFIDDLKLQANIVQVIQEYVSLKRVGRTYKGLCPFHGEKTPSFHVDPEKGFFHCFGCNVGGDVFKFLELHEKVGFAEAVKMLAQKAGMSLPEPTEGDPSARQDSALREALLKMHEMATVYFREQLAAPAGNRARQQLTERGVSAQTIEQLGLGFAPQSREGLKARLLAQGFSQALIVQSGLVVQRDGGPSTGSGPSRAGSRDGEVIDRFRNRLMIPICRDTGSVIAFGGRAMDTDQVPKYLNSPETPIYSKSRTLYGLQLLEGRRPKAGLRGDGRRAISISPRSSSHRRRRSSPRAARRSPSQQAQLLRRFTTRSRAQLRPGCGRTGRGRPVVRAACGRGVRRQRPGTEQGRGSRHVHQEERSGGLPGKTQAFASIPRVPAGPGGRRGRILDTMTRAGSFSARC